MKIRRAVLYKLMAFVDGETAAHPPAPCGHCKKEHVERTQSSESKRAPQAGDYCVCAECFGINQYDDEMRMVPLHRKELRQLPRAEREQLLGLQTVLREAFRAARQESWRVV